MFESPSPGHQMAHRQGRCSEPGDIGHRAWCSWGEENRPHRCQRFFSTTDVGDPKHLFKQCVSSFFIHFRRLPTTILNFVFLLKSETQIPSDFCTHPFSRRVSDLVQCKGSSCQRTQDVTPALLASIFPLLR